MKQLTLTDEQKARLGVVEGPIFDDACEHTPGSYVCSFKTVNQYGVKSYDLYLFPEPFFGTEVCIRYGNEVSEYISPGGLGDFMFTAGTHWKALLEYRAAADILREFGTFGWAPRVQETGIKTVELKG